MRVAVVGGSLGGLTTALLLRDSGHGVTVYERAPKPLEERGAGIGLLRETSRYLTERAGVDINDISIRTDRIRHLGRAGDVVSDDMYTYRFSSWNTIYRRLLAAFGRERYLLGHEVQTIDQTDTSARLGFESGETVDCDLVVCADGVGSRFRSLLAPQAIPQYSGYVAWRGMVPESELGADTVGRLGDAITYVVIANSHILVYPIPGLDGSVRPGERLINFVWYRNYLEGFDLDDVLTGNDGERREVSVPPGMARPEHVDELRAHAIARLPKVIADVVVGAALPFVQVVLDVEAERMVFGRVCLLGDAAWVARPHAAAGTAKAADDAWSLVTCLDEHATLPEALKAWEARQMSVGSALVARTRAIGAQSQFDGTWNAADPSHVFGLHGPGE